MRGAAWKEAWSVEFICRIMQVTSRGFRAWRDRPMNQRQRDDMVLLAHIREQHRLSLQSYGRPRMTEELQELGLNVGHGRVGRLMRENGIKVIRTRKYKVRRVENLIGGANLPTQDRWRPQRQHRAQPAGSGLR